MSYQFSGSKLQQMLKHMGEEDLKVLAEELLPAVEELAMELSPESIKAGEAAVEAVLNPVLQPALQKLIDGVKL